MMASLMPNAPPPRLRLPAVARKRLGTKLLLQEALLVQWCPWAVENECRPPCVPEE